MEKLVMYKCSVCGLTNSEYPVVAACERRHLRLTKGEVLEWKKLNKDVGNKSAIASLTCNETTRNDLDEAIEALVNFERNHQLEGKRIPELL